MPKLMPNFIAKTNAAKTSHFLNYSRISLVYFIEELIYQFQVIHIFKRISKQYIL